jgi:hypothetical protein
MQQGATSRLLSIITIVVITLLIVAPMLQVVSVKVIQAHQFAKLATIQSNSKKLIVVTVNEQEYKSYLVQKEINYNGSMYEIHSVSKVNTTYTLRLLPDDKETYLQHFTQNLQHKTKAQSKINQFVFYYIEHIREFNFTSISTNPTHVCYYVFNTTKVLLHITSPPPQV